MAGSLIKTGLKKPTVVVEIGNDWLKILEYNPSYRGGYVTRASFVKLVSIKEPVTEALAKAFKGLKLAKQDVIVCVPRHLVTVRTLEFPSVDPKEIRDMINLQVGKQTPYSREEIIFSYRPIRVTREGYTKVMLVIVRRNIVNARVDVMQKAGIEVGKIAVSTEGVYNWFCLAYAPEVVSASEGIILLDIDSNYSDFIVIHGGQLTYTRNILIGSNHLLEEGDKWRDKFIEEVGHSIELLNNEDRQIKPHKIFLCGAGRHIRGFCEPLSVHLRMPVTATDTLTNFHVRNDVRTFQNENFVFVSASPILGMAANRRNLQIDLTSSDLKIHRDIEVKRRQIMIMGILAVSIVMVGSLLLLISLSLKSSYLAQLKKEIAKISKVAEHVEKMRQYIILVEGRLDARQNSINVFHEIHKLTPKEIYFTSVTVEEGKKVLIQGRADAMSNVFSFVTTLEESPYFVNVKTTYTTTKKDEAEEYTKFEIICQPEGVEAEGVGAEQTSMIIRKGTHVLG